MKRRLTQRSSLMRHMYRPRVERLEDRTLLSSAAVTTFAANPQHTGDYQATAQSLDTIKWQTPVDLDPQYSGGALLIHYGAALATANNTIIVSTKTGATNGFELNAFNGSTASGVNPTPMYTLSTDYILPSADWTPSFGPALSVTSSGTRLYYAGAGGTVYYISNPDSPTPGPVTQVAFYGLQNYQANESAFNSSVFIDTPITTDSNGDLFFGFRVQGTAPAPLNTTQSGYARIDANGNGSYVLAGTAANDSNITSDNHNTAPALSNDGSTLYVVVKSAGDWSNYGYLLGLNSTTLATEYRVFLTDPASGQGAGILDDSTASPMVGPDGDVYLGVMGDPYNGSRGYLLHFNSTLTQEYAPGAFGWDSTAAIVPASMVPSYTGTSSYLIFSKYNNYAGAWAGSYEGNGVNQVALLDPHAVETDPHNDGNSSLQVMREVFAVNGPTPDPDSISSSTPNAVREWCINTAAVDPALDGVFFPSEDGHLYRWCLRNDQLMQAISIGSGTGQAYVPTVIGPDGTLYAVNDATLYAIGNNTSGESITITSSNQDVRGTVVGNSITFTAKVKNLSGSGNVATGTVTFTDTVTSASGVQTTTTLGSMQLNSSGTASLTLSSLAAEDPGAHFITAIYSGDSNFAAGQAEVVQFVHESGTTTTLSVSSNSIVYGQSVTFSATVTPTTGGFATPTGFVTFMDGTTFLGQTLLNSAGQTSFTTSSLAPGSQTITAIYESDSVYAMSSGNNSSNPVIVQEGTNTTVTSSPNPSVFGQSVTVTATVTSVDAGAGTPSGTVTFALGGNVLASGVPVNSVGQASFSTTALPVGTDIISAAFTGNSGWASSSGDDRNAPQLVLQDSSTTTVSAAPATSVFGTAVVFTATVTANAPGSGTPTGAVTFTEGAAILGTGVLNGNGQTTLATSALAVGSQTITATYGGDANFTKSTGTTTEIVTKGTTSVAVAAVPNVVVYSQPVTLTALVRVVTGVGIPTGSVTFTVGSTILGAVAINVNGEATITTAALGVGVNTVVATYSGDANFAGNWNRTFVDVVQDGTITKLIYLGSVGPSGGQTYSRDINATGGPKAFLVTVTGLPPATGIPTGLVAIKDGNTVVAQVTLANGQSRFTLYLSAGTHYMSAIYGGSDGFKSSTSPTIVITVAASVPASPPPSQDLAVGQAATPPRLAPARLPATNAALGSATAMNGTNNVNSTSTIRTQVANAPAPGDQNLGQNALASQPNTADASQGTSELRALDVMLAAALGDPFFLHDLLVNGPWKEW